MASAPLNWLLKIGGATLKTTAKTLSEAVNTLHDTVTNLGTTVTNLGTTVTNLGTSKADASTTTTALNNLETNKLNISDLLSLEEIEASTSLTGKGVTAESIKSLNNSLGTLSFGQDDNGNWGYRIAGADPVIPFKSGIKLKKTCNQSQLTIDEDYDECLLVFASAGAYGSLAITNGGNYTMEEAGKSMTTNTGTVNGQSNTGCFLIKNLPKGAIISATKNNSAVTIWNYGFWLFA